ncbi:isoleucine--tRNA ligase, partial [candidate division KSB1 bacterium]
PFSGEEVFNKNFPADFIAEGVDQTRGWFYSLLAISTLITGKSSYKNCLSIELILDKDGQKMSKSKGNTVNPFDIFDTEGADALRWYLFTVSPPWVPTKFDREGVKEVFRKFLGTLTNTYSFFVMYANVDNFKPGEKHIPIEQRPEIDRWLISSRNSLVKKVNELLQRFDVTRAARLIQNFVIDELSNWYVRRNRRRFWKSEMGDDKFAAFETLYETLLTVSQLTAPFIPFISEEIYRNLTGTRENFPESVHLAKYPDPDNDEYKFNDLELESRMGLAKQIVVMCRSARNDAKIKVRQPLEKVYIYVQGDKEKKSIEMLKDLILEEINVKDIELVDSTESLLTKRALPVFSKLGPVFGKDVNKAAEEIRNLEEEKISEILKGEKVEIKINDNKFSVSSDMIEIKSEPKNDLVVQQENYLTVALYTRISDQLKAEGFAREFVNRVQNMRKEAGYNITDRIEVYYNADDSVAKMIDLMEKYIKKEVLATAIFNRINDSDLEKEIKIENYLINVAVKLSN